MRISRTDVLRRWCKDDAFTNPHFGAIGVNDTTLALDVGVAEGANPGIGVAFVKVVIRTREG